MSASRVMRAGGFSLQRAIVAVGRGVSHVPRYVTHCATNCATNWIRCASLLGVLSLSACVTTTTTVEPDGRATRSNAASSPAANRPRVSDAPTPGRSMPAPIGDAAVRLDLRNLGAVATDGFTLPILSPCGNWMAVQTGTPPDLATALARPLQQVPRASRVALYRLQPNGIIRLGETAAGLVLGRSADSRGFLVESQRPDGARWIGRIGWGTESGAGGYEPEWLVQDGAVNAFAALGPNGELAFSRREIAERRFDLIVQRDGRTARLPADGMRSALFPSFSADGSRVFALILRDGIVEVGSMDPTDDSTMSQGLTRLFVTDRGDDTTATQMTTPQGTRQSAEGRDYLFFHPTLRSITRWNEVDGLRGVHGGTLAIARVDERRIAVLESGRVRIRTDTGGARDSTDLTTTEAAPVLSGAGVEILNRVAVPRSLGMFEGQPALLLFEPEPPGVRIWLARILN